MSQEPAILKNPDPKKPNPLKAYFDNVFTYHPPTKDQTEKYVMLRSAAKRASASIFDGSVAGLLRFALLVDDVVPEGEEHAQAMMACVHAQMAFFEKDAARCVQVVRNAVMWANAGIACTPAS